MWKVRKVQFNPLFEEFENVFEDVFHGFFNDVQKQDVASVIKSSHYPKLDIADENDALFIYATVPGLERSDIDIDYDESAASITIAIKKSSKRSNKNYTHKEIKMSASYRVINNIRKDIFNVGEISAVLENGILELKLPRVETKEAAEERRKIEIK